MERVERVGSSVQAIPFTVVGSGPCRLVIMLIYPERESLVVDQGLLVVFVGRKGVRCGLL